MFSPSLQTHFNARVDHATLQQIRSFGFRWARIDAQQADVWTMHDMMADAASCDLTPLPIVYDLDRLGQIPADCNVEWGNEPDGDIWPATYRAQLEDACQLARDNGLRLWAPAISNLDWDTLHWMKAVRGDGWPAGLTGISVHRYGDGTFEYAHPPFTSRADEVAFLRTLLDGLPYMVTEFGYPTTPGRRGRIRRLLGERAYARSPVARGLTEQEQAECIAKEWEFWRAEGCAVPFLYQINDGPTSGYGIRRCAPDGTLLDWKPAAYQVPKEAPMDLPKESAALVISKRESFPHPEKPNCFATWYPKGQRETILCVEADGSIGTRNLAEIGGVPTAWESWEMQGDRAVFMEAAQTRALPLVE